MDKPKFETDNGKFVELARFKTEAGLTAVIRYAINRNQDSYYCGYVQVPKGSVLDGLQWHEDPNDILESIWDNTQGGDTWIDWSGELSSILDHNTENLGWAFGFDTNHPSFSTSKLACQLSELQEEITYATYMTHASFDYIKQKCELLAKKLHKIISKEEVLMETNSANEELRYQLKCPPKFTPFNPNFFERKFTLDELKALNFQPASCGIMPMSKIDEITNYTGVCFSDQTWGLSEEGITYLNDQITQIIHDHHQPEAEPVKEQPAPTELLWQDINTLKNNDWDGTVLLYEPFTRHGVNGYDYRMESASYMKDNWDEIGVVAVQWMPVPEPKKAPPVEPERVSVQEFAKDPVGKWVKTKNLGEDYNEAYYHLHLIVDVIAEGHPIYATKPTAWLAWKAEQEGKSV